MTEYHSSEITPSYKVMFFGIIHEVTASIEYRIVTLVFYKIKIYTGITVHQYHRSSCFRVEIMIVAILSISMSDVPIGVSNSILVLFTAFTIPVRPKLVFNVILTFFVKNRRSISFDSIDNTPPTLSHWPPRF